MKRLKRIFTLLANKHIEKIKRQLDDVSSLKIHFKEHKNPGSNKFHIQGKVTWAMNAIEANVEDWDVTKAIHKMFKKLEEEIEHKQHKKGKPKR